MTATDLEAGLNGDLGEKEKLPKSQDVYKTVQVKGADGKAHQLVYNETRNQIIFILLGNKRRELAVNYSEILAIRNLPVKLYGGLPKKVEEDGHNKQHPNALYIYYTYRHNIYKWRLREAAVYFTTTSEKKQWEGILREPLTRLTQRPRNIMIFINPFGGKGKAKSIYDKQVEPILELVGLKRKVVLTERANHAFDIVQELEPDSWNDVDGVVSVGGDGLFNEILFSSVIRTQNEHGKNIDDVNVDELARPRFRFGIIGAGSANSIVSSVHGVDDVPTAAVHIAIGSKCAVDVCTVHQGDKLFKISANAISYGWLGDVMQDSERYRFMGPVSQEQPDPHLPHHWQTDFTHCICCVIPCVSPFTPYGLAPYAGVGDGTMDLALVPKVTRCQNLQIMRTVSMYGGKELLPRGMNLKVYRVKRWSFTPGQLVGAEQTKAENPTVQGAWNLDGEIMPQPADKPLHFRLHPMLISYFGKELDLDDPRYQKCHCCYCPTKYSSLVVLD